MIFARRHAELLDCGAFRSLAVLIRPDLRISVMRSQRLAFDSLLLQSAVGSDWQRRELSVVLEGRYLVRAGQGLNIEEGSALLAHQERWNERWDAQPLRTLTVEWLGATRRLFGGAAELAIGRRPLARLRALASRIESGPHTDEREPIARDILRELDALGLLQPEDLVLPSLSPPPGAQRLADAMSRLGCNLAGGPALCDLEADISRSSRHLRRLTHHFADWLDTRGLGHRELLRNRRLVAATSMLSVAEASVPRVAASLGYSGERALRTALQQAGLGSPSEIRQALAT